MLTSSAPALKLPLLNSKNNLLVAVGEVLRAMAERRIKRSEADTFLCGLKFASRLMTEIDREAESHSTGADDAHAPNARPSREASAERRRRLSPTFRSRPRSSREPHSSRTSNPLTATNHPS